MTSTLHPATTAATGQANTMKQGLEATLHCLDVRLEDELARYRRRRRGAAVMPMGLRREPAKPASLDLISIKASTIEREILPTTSANSYSSIAAAMAATMGQFESPPLLDLGPLDLGPDADRQLDRIAADDALLDPIEMRRIEEQELELAQAEAEGRSIGSPIASPIGSPIGSGSSLAVIPGALQVQDEPTGDYLASSEALLESLAQAEQDAIAAPPPSRIVEALFSPLGVGGLLLTLLTSATLGYFIANPSSIARIQTRLFPRSAPTQLAGDPVAVGIPSSVEAPGQVAPGQVAPGQVAPGQTAQIIPGETTTGPDLSSKEFVDLSIDSLSGINANGAPSLMPPVVGAAGTTGAPMAPTSIPAPIDPSTLIPRRTSTAITVTEQAPQRNLMTNLMSAVSIGRQLPGINQIPFIGKTPTPPPLPAPPVMSQPRAVAPVTRSASSGQSSRPVSQPSRSQASQPARSQASQPTSQSAIPLPPPIVLPIDPNTAGPSSTALPSTTSGPSGSPGTSQSVPDGTYSYTVVTGYSGEKGLAQIKQYAPNAKLISTPEGEQQVQAGSFSELAQAGSLAGQLRGQGLSVQVEQRYSPAPAPAPTPAQ
jgi:hypothetical protein